MTWRDEGLKAFTIVVVAVLVAIVAITWRACSPRPSVATIEAPALDITPLLEPIQEAGRTCQAAYERAQENASALATQRAQIDDLRCVLMYQAERVHTPIAKHAWRAAWPGFEQCASCNSGHRCNVSEEP